MATSPYLFDISAFEPKSPKPRRRRFPASMPPGVRAALARLKRTMDAIPREEWERRLREREEFEKSQKN